MPVNARILAGCAALLSVASLGAANDLRLLEAVKNRDKATVRALLQQKPDVNMPQPDGATALHWATHWDDLETANLLIRAGADVNVANDYGVTPLSLACTNGNAAMVETLLKAGANPNAALPTGETPLMTAARTGDVAVVKELLARGADATAKETMLGQTPLMWAATEGHAETARLLLQHGADVHARSTTGFTPLLFAARKGDPKTTQVLLAAGVDVNEAAPDGPTALLIATIRGHTDFAAFLLDQGANPNLGPGFTPLHWAAGEWPTELTGATTGIIANDTEWSALGGLRGQAKLEFVKVLLAHGADPNARAQTNPRYDGFGGTGGNLAGATPFLMAARAGDVAVMRVLLAGGADPLLVTNGRTTALMLASKVSGSVDLWMPERSFLEAVKLALELGSDVNAVNAGGDTALHGAANFGHNMIVQFLVDHGAKLNVKNKAGQTPVSVVETGRQFPGTTELLHKLGRDQP